MNRIYATIGTIFATVLLFGSVSGQGDVRSATGMPIPIGASVIWGQVELRGLQQNETKPIVTVALLINGAQIGTSQANDRGYYYFLQRARDGAVLVVYVGGTEVGRQMISSAGGDRYDMAVDWRSISRSNSEPGVVSVRDMYTERTEANNKLFDKASNAAKSKDTDKAVKLFSELVASDPNDYVAWTELASLYFEQSKYSEAEEAYGKALALKSDFMPALMNLGKLQMARKKFDAAVAVLEKAVAADPKSADAFHYLGESYLQAKLGSKAVVVLNESIRLAPMEKADVHLRLASLYNAAGLKDRAATEYKLFLEKEPDHPEKSKLEKYIKENLK